MQTKAWVDLVGFLGIMGVISEQRSIEHSSMIENRKNKGGGRNDTKNEDWFED